LPIAALKPTEGTIPAPPPSASVPTITAEIAFASNPGAAPVYTNVSAYLRDTSTARGRNYEYERNEAGTATFTLSNRDSRFNPENTAGPYYGTLKPTRRTRLRAVWEAVTFDLFNGYTKGYPQEFPSVGYDAVVRQRATDMFYRLNLAKFRPGSTTLAASTSDTASSIAVTATALPMPRAVPFTIKIDFEELEVTAINSPTTYQVTRGQNGTVAAFHPAGAAVTTLAVSFAQELSGTRIRNVLDMLGVLAADRDIAAGVSLISVSDDLAGTNMLEHLQLIAEAENGRLFVSKSGLITFHDRHWVHQNERSDRATLSDTGAPGTLPYLLDGPVSHDEQLIANVVRVTPDSGNTQSATDQTSIDENFERTLEKQWPLALDTDAEGAADWMLNQLKDTRLRIPQVTLDGRSNAAVMWPLLLGMEIGQRYGFRYTPRGGGTAITRSVIVEGIQHDVTPSTHKVRLQLAPADITAYWRLGVAGYSELGSTTRLTY
jgi:hypothetical protein